MSMQVFHHARAAIRCNQVVGRRDFIKGLSLASLAAGALSWSDLMSLEAAELRKRGMACILLYMHGGPSQFESFSPLEGHENGGGTKAISTAVPGIRIAESYPEIAKVMGDLAIIRSMTSKEGNHSRAQYLVHTGYSPTPTIRHPSLGAIAAHEIANKACELPSYVQVGNASYSNGGGGFLGVEYDPFMVNRTDRLPDNASPTTVVARYRRRQNLLSLIEADYAASGGATVVADHRKLYDQASRMILSSQMTAFDLSREPIQNRRAYGQGDFASGCLLARRLVEEGVTFVEVSLTGWDTHENNFKRSAELAHNVDQPMAHLITDLKQRGLLDKTLVIWMGEFGRTPKINGRAGRDHFPNAFSVVLSGGGIRGGQVIGRVSPDGMGIDQRPVTVPDLFHSFCQSLKIDPNREQMTPIGRPIKIADDGTVVKELFG